MVRRRLLVAAKSLCAAATVLVAYVLLPQEAKILRRGALRRKSDGRGRRNDDGSDRYPSPYVREDPPDPERDAGWDELVTVVSPPEEGARVIGERSTWEVHTEGLWHRDVFVVVRVGNFMLLQRRSAAKWVYPGVWEYSASETMEGDESFADAADRAVREEMGGILREGAPFPELTKCCGPITYVWEGEMPHMYLRERTVVEIFGGQVEEGDLDLGGEGPAAVSDRWRARGNSTLADDDGWMDEVDGWTEEVQGWILMPISTLREEARTFGARKYGPHLLDALDPCRMCWRHRPGPRNS